MYQDLEDLKEFNADIQFRLNEVFYGDGESRSTPQQDLGLAICANMMGFNRAKMRRSHGQFLFFNNLKFHLINQLKYVTDNPIRFF